MDQQWFHLASMDKRNSKDVVVWANNTTLTPKVPGKHVYAMLGLPIMLTKLNPSEDIPTHALTCSVDPALEGTK